MASSDPSVQLERLRNVAEILSDYAAHPNDQIRRILEFAYKSLGMEEGAISFVESNIARIAYAATPGLPIGRSFPWEQSFMRHVFGSRSVLAIANTNCPEWENDAAVLAQEWRSYIGTTIFVEQNPVGVISLGRYSPRAMEFEAADFDFVRILAALVGTSLERIRSEERLEQQAYCDGVTGLANRAAFEEGLSREIARVDRHGGHVRLHFIDLDGFKEVNDTLGHGAGDECLRMVAARLRNLVRQEDTVARLGGDEFVVLEHTATEEGDSDALGRRICAAVSEMMYIDGRIVRIGASVGVASYPRHAKDEAALLACADSAMYAAKTAGKGAVKLYSYG